MRVRRPAAAAAATVLLLLAACGDGDSPAEAVRRSAGDAAVETTTTTASPAVTSTTAGRTSTTGRTTTSTTRATTASTAAAGARALSPATPGTYRYATVGSTTVPGNVVAFPAVTTLVVDPPSGSRQRATRDLRDASGNGTAMEFVLDYRPEGVFLVSLRLTVGFSGVTVVRDLRPTSPAVLLPTGARPGGHVEADLAGTSPAKLVVDVLGEERVTIGGRALDTLVVRTAVTLGPGDVTGRQELTLNVDRGSRLWVKERSVADASAAGGLFTLHSEYTATLQRLTP
jgi:hypothetical protein